MWYEPWYAGPLIVPHVMNAVRHCGALPMITWMPRDSPFAGASLSGIASGSYDGYLERSAAAARAWGHPLLLRPFHEMNGRWTPWAVGVRGNTVAEFVAAWRHIVTVFRSDGATNVRFVFSPNVISPNSPDFRPEYPGDRYVDWVALDGYNWGTSVRGQHWRSFRDVFAHSYDVLTSVSSRPMMIAETASSESGGDKSLWIARAFRDDMQEFPRVRAVVWFNHRTKTSWPITSSRAALDAYRAVAKAE
jgi:endoglucanase